MRAVFGLVLIVGLGLAGFAVYMVQGHFETQEVALARQRAVAARQTPTVEVYAVNRQITYGEELTLEDVHLIRYAEPFLPEGVFVSEEELFPEGEDELRLVLRQMEENEPILAIKVTQPGEDIGITSRLAPGMRAFAISVDASSGVSGFLRPGDRVDIYWSGSVRFGNFGNGENVTKLIETGIGIIAVDQTANIGRAEATIARTVTVEVNPQQVAELAQAQSTGSLSLSLVGNSDETVAMAIEVDQRSLLGIVSEPEPVQVAEPEQPRLCTIRTRRGSEVVEIPIPCRD